MLKQIQIVAHTHFHNYDSISSCEISHLFYKLTSIMFEILYSSLFLIIIFISITHYTGENVSQPNRWHYVCSYQPHVTNHCRTSLILPPQIIDSASHTPDTCYFCRHILPGSEVLLARNEK